MDQEYVSSLNMHCQMRMHLFKCECTVSVVNHILVEILARRKFPPILPPALIGKILSREFFSSYMYIDEYIETFTALVTIYSNKYFCNTKR